MFFDLELGVAGCFDEFHGFLKMGLVFEGRFFANIGYILWPALFPSQVIYCQVGRQ